MYVVTPAQHQPLTDTAMMTLRCTQKLLDHLPPTPAQQDSLQCGSASAPTTALGDWFATLVVTRPAHLVLCLSEHSRLCVVVPAREPKLLLSRFDDALDALLHHIGVAKAARNYEKTLRRDIHIGSTRGHPNARSLLGSLNEATRLMKWEVQNRRPRVDKMGLLELSLYLNEIPSTPLGTHLPHEVARRLVEHKYAEALPPTEAPFVFRPRLVP